MLIRIARRSVLALALVLWFSVIASAQAMQASGLKQVQAILQEKMRLTPTQRKLDSHIHFTAQAASGALTVGMIPAVPNMVTMLQFEPQGTVHVDIQATVTPDRKSTRLNSSHLGISYAVFCLKKKITK